MKIRDLNDEEKKAFEEYLLSPTDMMKRRES